MASIQGVYVALFGRPADPTGLAYFNAETNNGADLTAIGDLSATAEFQTRFEGQSYAQIVNAIYQSLFDRDADIAGLNFFVSRLVSGEFTVNDVAIRILDGAQGNDKTIVDNKIEAANLYTDSLDTAQEVIAYTGDAAAAQGRAFLEGVTTTVPDQAAVDAAVAAMVGGGGVVGSTFTLTTDVDALVGTNNNDTFQAIFNNAATDTINTFDDIDGGAGRDTLLIVGTPAGAALPANTNIRNIEVVNVAAVVGGLDSAYFQGIEELWQVGVSEAVTVGAGVTAGFRNVLTAAGDTVTAADGVASVSVALDGVTTASEVEFGETTAGDVTSVTVSGSVAGAGALTVDTATGTTAVETINLGLTSDGVVTLDVLNAVVTTISASASTGDLTIDASAVTALETLTGGSGNDTLSATIATSTAETITINAGSGTDVINLVIDNSAANVAASLTGGAGGDTFTLTSTAVGNLNAVADADDLIENLITITDFAKADDVLDISDFAGARVAQNVVNNAVTAAAPADLLEAATAAASTIAVAGDYALFTFGTDTYIFVDVATAGTVDAGDALIKLTGVAVGDLTAANFIA